MYNYCFKLIEILNLAVFCGNGINIVLQAYLFTNGMSSFGIRNLGIFGLEAKN